MTGQDEYPLTDEQINFYQENGYIQLHDVLTPEELEQARAALEAVDRRQLDARTHVSAANPEYEAIFVQKVNLWRVDAAMREVVLNPKVASIARRLAGAKRLRLWHDHALVKMPGKSKPSAWHQDLPYWPMKEPGALSCWMALDDVSEANGCMSFVPRSHSWGRLEPIRLGDPQDLFGLVDDPESKDFTPRPMPMRAGSCTFHHGLTFHYAGPNTTDRPRRAMVTIYMPDGTTYNGAPHVVTDPLAMSAGEPLAGELFPVLAEAD